MTTETMTRKPREPRNGVNVPQLFATIDAVRGQPELARFTWRASGRWMGGTHTRSEMSEFEGAGGAQTHGAVQAAETDHPAVLCGEDHAPTPVETLLAGLAGCLTAGIANIASARGVDLQSVEAVVEGDMDLRGILGLSDEVRNGVEGVRVTFHVKGDASPETMREIVEQSRARSAVFDVFANRVPVTIAVA